MPKITDMQIQKSNKARANLYIDGEFAFGVEMLTVMKLGLKIGQEVSEQKLQEAIFDSEKSVAFEKAMDYLSRSMKTQKQICDYLYKKGYAPAVVRYVVDKLVDYKYVDDQTYARVYVEQNGKTKGSRRLRQELLQKGIAREQAEEFSSIPQEVAKNGAASLAQKYMRNKPNDVKTLQKLQRYLLSRGYDFDTVNGVVRLYKSDSADFFD
ncbi:MAG: RecX family transcriptional regulator [Corallococcus sp.]|nr:RecX family transcriptional regulator [Corallococcus sp.]MCM1360079.1 RecX family transcriptional regulator [Corallococcus sp.]MCM1395636.1 RecX family transcriptional regulator [Corallococcus sp.]